MTETCTLVIIKAVNDVQVRYGMPKHSDMIAGYPWVYIDAEGEKYYPIFSAIDGDVYIVKSQVKTK